MFTDPRLPARRPSDSPTPPSSPSRRLWPLVSAFALSLAAAAGAAVTDFQMVLPDANAPHPSVKVIDSDHGIQQVDLDEAFDENGLGTIVYKDYLRWWPSLRQGRTSYVLTLMRHNGDQLAGATYVTKRVDEDGHEAWRKGPWDAYPEGVSQGCERVLFGRGRGERGTRSLVGLFVLDAAGDSIYAVNKEGLAIGARISPNGDWMAYVDQEELVTHDLAADKDYRDSLVRVKNVSGTYDPRWLSGIRDDGTVVFEVQITEMSRDSDFAPAKVLTKLFKHGQ